MIETTIETVLTTLSCPLILGTIPLGQSLPAVTYNLISDVETLSHDGVEFFRRRFQFTVSADTYSDVNTINEEIKTLLNLNKTDFLMSRRVITINRLDPETGVWNGYSDYIIDSVE